MTRRNCSGVSRVAGKAVPTPGVVDEDVDPPEGVESGVYELLTVLRDGDIGGDRDGPTPGGLHGLGRGGQQIHPTSAESDICARFGQALGERHSEAGRSPRHYRYPVVQPEPVQNAHGRSPRPLQRFRASGHVTCWQGTTVDGTAGFSGVPVRTWFPSFRAMVREHFAGRRDSDFDHLH
jgi:hypothetical protein